MAEALANEIDRLKATMKRLTVAMQAAGVSMRDFKAALPDKEVKR